MVLEATEIHKRPIQVVGRHPVRNLFLGTWRGPGNDATKLSEFLPSCGIGVLYVFVDGTGLIHCINSIIAENSYFSIGNL